MASTPSALSGRRRWSPTAFVAKLYSLGRLSSAERRAVYDRMTPESGRALFETLNWWLDPFMTTSVNAATIRAPVFAAAGGRDLDPSAPATVRTTAQAGWAPRSRCSPR